MAAVLSVIPSPTAPKLSGLQTVGGVPQPPPSPHDASNTDNEAGAVRRVNRSMNDRHHTASSLPRVLEELALPRQRVSHDRRQVVVLRPPPERRPDAVGPRHQVGR